MLKGLTTQLTKHVMKRPVGRLRTLSTEAKSTLSIIG